MNKQNISILFKPVSFSCNIQCTYCYYHERQDSSIVYTDSKTLKSILESLQSLPSETKINFLWHGGEPLLAGKSFFKELIRLQEEIIPDKKVKYGMQTNALLIDSEWCEIFKKNKMHIGVSLDGTEDIHNNGRISKSGSGTYKEVINKINLLQKYDIPFGILTTITKKSLGQEKIIFNNFIKLEIYKFDFLPCLESTDNSNINTYEWADFTIKMFDLWFNEDNPNIKIRFFEEIIKTILGGKPSLCTLSKGCSSLFTINNNGVLYACDDSENDSDNILGNLLEEDFVTLQKNKNILIQKRFEYEQAMNCNFCEFNYICNSYCPRYYHLGIDLCNALKIIFSHIVSSVES